MAVTDLKKTLKGLYLSVPREPQLVKVPALNYLMVDGKGDPNTSKDFREAIQALYGLSYTLKFTLKSAGVEYVVMPLEGLFHAKNPAVFLQGKKDQWHWTIMILQPKGCHGEEGGFRARGADAQAEAVHAAGRPPAAVRRGIVRAGAAHRAVRGGAAHDRRTSCFHA